LEMHKWVRNSKLGGGRGGKRRAFSWQEGEGGLRCCLFVRRGKRERNRLLRRLRERKMPKKKSTFESVFIRKRGGKKEGGGGKGLDSGLEAD